MTPKEKATELVEKFKDLVLYEKYTEEPIFYIQKECALIAVDEILEAHFMKRDSGYKTYWINVRKEIEKL